MSGEGQIMVRWSSEVQVRVKSKYYSELDIGGHETCNIPVLTHRGALKARDGCGRLFQTVGTMVHSED